MKEWIEDVIERELERDLDLAWMGGDLSRLGEFEPYEWGEGEMEEGKPVRYEPGFGFVVGDGPKDDSPSSSGLGIGDVVFALFPSHRPGGHEQEGMRPAVVIGLPGFLGEPRFGVLVVAPLTTDRGQEWAERSPGLYPRFPKGTENLRLPSICLLDQIRALDAGRIRRYRGRLNRDQYRPVGDGLRRVFASM